MNPPIIWICPHGKLWKELANFKGTVIAISHDRFFLKRCVTRILAIESGKIVSYDGNYDSYRKTKTQSPEKEIKRTMTMDLKDKPNKAKLKKQPCQPESAAELELIEEQIEKLEKRIRKLEADFCRRSSYQAYDEYNLLIHQVNLLYQEWNGRCKI